ncbi:hypothetical protein PG984_011637 [Apiospora sp. TS-2023a]
MTSWPSSTPGVSGDDDLDAASCGICEGFISAKLSFATSAATASSAAAAASSASPLPLPATDSTCSQAIPLSVPLEGSVPSCTDGDLGLAASTTRSSWPASSATVSIELRYELFGVRGENTGGGTGPAAL